MSRNTHVILVALDIEAESREEAHALALEVLPKPSDYRGRTDGPLLDSWWIAEDDRTDRSDNDSAIFVKPGQQTIASQILWEADQTGKWNVVDGRNSEFGEGHHPDGWWHNAKHDEDDSTILSAATAWLHGYDHLDESAEEHQDALKAVADALCIPYEDVEAIA